MNWKYWLGIETRDNIENPSVPLMEALTGGITSSSGVSMNANKSLQLAAVNASVRVIAESAAALPLHLYSKQGRSRERVLDDPRARLLSLQPNRYQTAMSLWENVFAHLAL